MIVKTSSFHSNSNNNNLNKVSSLESIIAQPSDSEGDGGAARSFAARGDHMTTASDQLDRHAKVISIKLKLDYKAFQECHISER